MVVIMMWMSVLKKYHFGSITTFLTDYSIWHVIFSNKKDLIIGIKRLLILLLACC